MSKLRNLAPVQQVIELPLRWYSQREAWVLLRFDAHEDSPFCRYDLLFEHLEEARKRKAVCIEGGDWFDAMGGRYDRRRDEEGTKPEHKTSDYYDAICDGVAGANAKYAGVFGLVGMGNHESSVLVHSGTNLTARLVEKLRRRGSKAIAAGYKGYVQIGGDKGVLLRWHHGSGGSAPVTRGVIGSARRAVFLRDPDISVTGHIHHQWMVPIARETVVNGKVNRHIQVHLQCPSYKDEQAASQVGWAVRKDFPPVPFGCWWLRFEKRPSGLKCMPIAEYA